MRGDAIVLFLEDSLASLFCRRYSLLELNKLGIACRARSRTIHLHHLLVVIGNALLVLEHQLSSALAGCRDTSIKLDGLLTLSVPALLSGFLLTTHTCLGWAPLLRNL